MFIKYVFRLAVLSICFIVMPANAEWLLINTGDIFRNWLYGLPLIILQNIWKPAIFIMIVIFCVKLISKSRK